MYPVVSCIGFYLFSVCFFGLLWRVFVCERRPKDYYHWLRAARESVGDELQMCISWSVEMYHRFRETRKMHWISLAEREREEEEERREAKNRRKNMLNKFITWCFLHNVTNIRHKLHKLMKLQNIRSAHGLSRHLSYAFFFRYIFVRFHQLEFAVVVVVAMNIQHGSCCVFLGDKRAPPFRFMAKKKSFDSRRTIHDG